MSLPYQPACDTPGLHQMTRDSDVTLEPSNIPGRQARYPFHIDRGGTSRNQTGSPGGSGRKRDTAHSAGPGGRLPLAPGFSRSGEYVGPRPSRIMTPLLQRPPDVTRHPHAWTETRIRAYPPRDSKSGPAPRGALHSRQIPSHLDHPGREPMEEVTQPSASPTRTRPDYLQSAARVQDPHARAGCPSGTHVTHTVTHRCQRQLKSKCQPITQPSTPFSNITTRGPRAGYVELRPTH